MDERRDVRPGARANHTRQTINPNEDYALHQTTFKDEDIRKMFTLGGVDVENEKHRDDYVSDLRHLRRSRTASESRTARKSALMMTLVGFIATAVVGFFMTGGAKWLNIPH